MKGMNARHLLAIALVLGIVTLACPVLGQTTPAAAPEAIWPTYHFDMHRGGRNDESKDTKDPSTIKAIWAFPRTDAGTRLPEDEAYVVDDEETERFFATGKWFFIDQTDDPGEIRDAVGTGYHITNAVEPDPSDPGKVYPEAFWDFPSADGVPPGRYQIFIWVPENPDATRRATYFVTDRFGTRMVTFDQRSNADTWQPLSNSFFTFTGQAGQGVRLTARIQNAGANEKVLADAIKFVPVPIREIYSSPVSANIPVTLYDPTVTSSPPVIFDPVNDGLGTCVYVGAVESGSLLAAEAEHDTGAVYCIYGIVPTTDDPEKLPAGSAERTKLEKIASYLGKPKWRYPRNGNEVNDRLTIEGPIEGGVYSSPTLATIADPSGGSTQFVCFVTGMDRQLYALDAVTGALLWKGPGKTVGEEDDINVVNNWQVTDTREDAFGGKFHYIACVEDKAATSMCTWNFLPADQTNAAPTGAAGLSYSIYAWMPEGEGTGTLRRSKTATYVISYPDADGSITTTEVVVDQSDPASFGSWVKIGSSYFNPTKVELKNTATEVDYDGAGSAPPVPATEHAVVADAIMFVPDTVEGMGYSTPITDADTVRLGNNALAERVFAVTENGRVLSFNVQTPGNYVGKLDWIYPAVRTKLKPSASDMDQPGLGAMGASPAFRNENNGQLFIAGMNGVITCLSQVKTSAPTEQWKFASDSDIDGKPGAFSSSPAIDGDRLYAASSAGHVYCLDANGARKDGKGNVVPVWEYPSNEGTNPLGAFRYSTPALGVSQGIRRLWIASNDGRIYSFKAETGERLYTDDDGLPHGDSSIAYDEPSFGLPVQASIALDGEGRNGEHRIMYVGDMGENSGTLHWRDAHTGQVNPLWSAGTTDASGKLSPYEGWRAPGVLFSSPNLTHLMVGTTPVTVIFVGCGDGHLIAFSKKGGAWGGEWQGGDWPFEGDPETQNAQRSSSAPVTDVQFDVFTETFFNESLGFDPEKDRATFDFSTWPSNVIVSKDMKFRDETDSKAKPYDPLTIDQDLIDAAKVQRNKAFLAPSRVDDAKSDTVFYEWGERIYAIVWNLPAQEWLMGSSIADRVKPRMTNASCGESAGATSGGQTGNVNGLVMQVRAIKDYTFLKIHNDPVSGEKVADQALDIEGQPVKRSYALISIDIDGSRDRPPGPGPGWTLYVDIDKYTEKTGGRPSGTTIHQTIPLAKLKRSGSGYEIVLVNNQVREAPLGINNPIAIRDDGIKNEANDGDVGIAWDNKINPDRTNPEAHLNGNYGWVSDASGTQPYQFTRLRTPLIYLGHVVHGTSSREAPLGIVDRSAMGVTNRQIPRFRIEDRDLMFRGGEGAIYAEYRPKDAFGQNLPPVAGGIKFPWDQGIGSIDYPHIYSRYQNYQLISTDINPATNATPLLPVEPAAGDRRHEVSLLRPDTVKISVDVPRFQPANTSPDGVNDPNGYSRTMVAFVDSNNNVNHDSGNVTRGRPTTWQEVYRTFRVQLKVPPDPKILVEEQLIDIGRAPHGLGQNMTGPFTFTAYNPNPLIQQWFKPITIKNAGNVNLYNIRLNQALGLLGDQASPSQQLPGVAITSSLDVFPAADPVFSAFAGQPFNSGAWEWNQKNWYLGYTLSKPRVGDVDPTVMTIPDRRKWESQYLAGDPTVQGPMSAAGWDTTKPLPVLVSVQVPLTQPVGTYQSWDPNNQTPYVSVFSDVSNRTSGAPAGPIYGSDPVAVPSFQLKVGVRENQLTGGVTPTTLPQIDLATSQGFFAKYGDSTPAAYRDANNDVRLFYSSNRMETEPPNPSDQSAYDAWARRLASAPWFIHEARLGYRQAPGSNAPATWAPASPDQWWQRVPEWMPASQWMLPIPPDLMKYDPSGDNPLYSVRHHSPNIGENLAREAADDKNRTWLAWAGTGEFRDPNNKVRQESLIFYTDITPDSDSAQGTPRVYAIEHDPSQIKRAPAIVPDGNRMWMFWQGGTAGNWSIFYSQNNGGPDFDTTKSEWQPDQRLRTPDCLAAVGSPNPILRRFGTDLRNASGDSSTDFTNPYIDEYNDPAKTYKAFDVVYAGTNKITRNSDIFLSRYDAYGSASNAPNRTGQMLARVYNERLARDPKLGFYTSKHIAWVRPTAGRATGTDHWGAYTSDQPDPALPNYVNPAYPYVHVVFPKAYTEGTLTLPAGSVISATDGSWMVGPTVQEPPMPITPEIDSASGVYTYSYPPGSAADQILGKMVVDYSSGIITFSKPFRETATVVDGVTVFSAPEVYADYTPQALRITTDAAVDGSPRAFIERTSMTDERSGSMAPGLDPNWDRGKPAPVDRLWVFWRKTGAAIENSTIFYTTMRIGIDLTKLGLPPIAMDPQTGGFAGPPDNPNVQIQNARGPWEVDRTGTKIYFSEVDERYMSNNFKGPNSAGPTDPPKYGLRLQYDYKDKDGSRKSIDQWVTDVSWITELPEQSLGFTMDANVNEGSIYAFADPQPQLSGTSVGVRSSKIWVFWTSTRGGNSDLFWETLSPNFWGR